MKKEEEQEGWNKMRMETYEKRQEYGEKKQQDSILREDKEPMAGWYRPCAGCGRIMRKIVLVI